MSKPDVDRATIAERNRGKHLLAAYVWIASLGKTEAAQDYSVTDAITSLLHYADSKGFDARELNRSALAHFEAESTVCPGCGHVGDPDYHDCKSVTA